MARADERRTQHSLVFRIEGLPSEALVGVEISRFLPRAQIVLQRSVASLQVAAQFPNSPWSIHSLRLLPQRVELDLSATPEVLTLQLLVTADDPFLFGQLNVPLGARTTIISPVETLRLYGPGYWAVPIWEPSQRGGRLVETGLETIALPQSSGSARLSARSGGKSIAAPAPKASTRSPAPVVSSKSNDETRETKP
jgi:hypothetical protein